MAGQDPRHPDPHQLALVCVGELDQVTSRLTFHRLLSTDFFYFPQIFRQICDFKILRGQLSNVRLQLLRNLQAEWFAFHEKVFQTNKPCSSCQEVE